MGRRAAGRALVVRAVQFRTACLLGSFALSVNDFTAKTQRLQTWTAAARTLMELHACTSAWCSRLIEDRSARNFTQRLDARTTAMDAVVAKVVDRVCWLDGAAPRASTSRVVEAARKPPDR